MTRRARLGPVALCLCLWLSAAAQGAAPTDPANVLDQLETALNSGNEEAFLAWFAPSGIVKERGGKSYASKDEIRLWTRAVVSHEYHTEHGPRAVAGSRITWSARVTSGDLRALGLQSVEGQGEATIVGGKVVSYMPAFCPGSMVLLETASARMAEERVRAFIEEAYNGGKAASIDEFCDPGFVDHAPLPGGSPSLDGLRAGVAALRSGFPDLKVAVDDAIASGDRIAVRVTYSGTQKGPYLGSPSTFRIAVFSAVEIYRLQNGKLLEHWGVLDMAGLSRQLGIGERAVPGAAPPKADKREGHGGILGWLL